MIADPATTTAIGTEWDSWFGMASQWIPFWEASPRYAARPQPDGDEAVASE